MENVAIESAIEDVVRQFADPLAFLRELIQNSIDAGSNEVELRFDYDSSSGLGTVTVQDWGEGMTREVIENRLVKLFNSTKDDDLTKIGKFGIGFISVLAVEPVVVCVDTGSSGEYWRVLLHPDRSYEILELEHPVEGTRVDVIIKTSADDFSLFVERGRNRVRDWCRHARAAVLLDGEDVREPFELDGLLTASFDEEGSRGVVALRSEHGSQGDYFSGGLLLQRVPSQWLNIAFKLDSRYLEHTLTRDQVLQDVNFHQAVERLAELVNGDLREQAKAAVRDWAADPDLRWDWGKVCEASLTAFDAGVWKSARFPTVGHELVDRDDCIAARKKHRLMLTRGNSHFTHLMPDDYLLLDVRPDSPPSRVLYHSIGRNVPVLEDEWVQVPIAAANSTGTERLLDALDRLLRLLGSEHRALSFGEFDYPYSRLEHRAFLQVPDASEPVRRADLMPWDPFRAKGHILVNVSHAVVADAAVCAETEPEWAAYTLLKAAALAMDAVDRKLLDEETDVKLATASLQARDRRVGGRR